jgi:hypothetical protein
VSRVRDAGLAVAVLAPLLVLGVVADAPLDPVAAAVGVAGCLALEWLLVRRREVVRAVWERRSVRVAAVVLFVVAAAVGVRLVGTRALTALAAGLVAYLTVLGAVALAERQR